MLGKRGSRATLVGETDRPDVVGCNGSDPLEVVGGPPPRVRARDELPGRAVPVLGEGPVAAFGVPAGAPDVGRGDRGYRTKPRSAGAIVGAFHLAPARPVPVEREGLVDRPIVVVTGRPHVVGSEGRSSVQISAVGIRDRLDPRLKALRSEARFQDLLHRVGWTGQRA